MNKFRVTCILEGDRRVFATRKKFETREEAEAYAATVAESRKPMIGYCQFETSYEYGHWVVYDPDGDETEVLTDKGDRFDELQAVWDFCEQFDRCMVFFNGVPCGSATKSPDEAGSGYDRCDGCGML